MFGLSLGEIMASIVFGAIGLYYFRVGKKFQQFSVLFCGLGLMVYPYFVTGIRANVAVGFLLWGTSYYCRNYL